MIKTNELRVGNYYQASIEFKGSIEATFDPFGAERIFLLTEDKLIMLLQLRKELLKWVNPVKLTEEWLLAAGALEQKLFYQFSFNIGDSKSCLTFEKDDLRCLYDGTEIPTKIEYVHQLQSFYFDLKGSELIFKNHLVKN